MTTACCDHCDGSLQNLFEAALRRSHGREFGNRSGRAADQTNRLQVVIRLEVMDNVVAEADYKATTCATLLAYCELLARMLRGRPIAEALGIRAVDLIQRVRGVPPTRHSRAALAIAALRAALADEEAKGSNSK